MGEHNVTAGADDKALRTFMKALLDDVRALERMLDEGLFESGVRRIGAEQEMFLIDDKMQAAPLASEVIAAAADPRIVTELARFNVEANASPREFGGTCLRELEAELLELVRRTSVAAAEHKAKILLTGILPTLRRPDLTLDNMAPIPRYHALNRALMEMRGGDFHVRIKGLDELEMHHDNVMLEACNTSFQIHFQVSTGEFARLYNAAQAVTAPVLAAAVNSPLLLGNRLWSETRVALFQQSVDARSAAHSNRGGRTRVSFGDAWVKKSALEIFREDIARFRVVLAADVDENPMTVLDRGEIPRLSALRLHTGTVYRWNRACYGVSEHGAHLRIENRVLPAGPTVLDEMANAALFFGLMSAVLETYDDLSEVMPFDDAKQNFFAAARHGLEAQFRWIGGETVTAQKLLLDWLIPTAREGLVAANIDSADADRYLSVIEERVRAERTGSRWILDTMAGLKRDEAGTTPDIRERALVKCMLENQENETPVHTWPLGHIGRVDDWHQVGYQQVGQFMTTDLFTVRPQDLIDLAASVMAWEHIRHVPVEDDQGHLVGLLTHRTLLRLLAKGHDPKDEVAVSDLMRADPLCVPPDMRTLDAMRLMRTHKVGCLPVVEGGKLVGLITESDLIEVSATLLEAHLSEA